MPAAKKSAAKAVASGSQREFSDPLLAPLRGPAKLRRQLLLSVLMACKWRVKLSKCTIRAILTLHRYLSAIEHRQQNSIATTVDQLSQPTQALLQAMDSVQPAGVWKLDDRPDTVTFYPTEINYNTLRQQARPYVLVLHDPRAISTIIKFTIRPPRTRSHIRGGEAWNP